MALTLHERGLFTWNEWAAALADEIKSAQAGGDPDKGNTYYRHWLATLEKLVAAKGVATLETQHRYRDAWDHAADRTPHGSPIELRAEDFPPHGLSDRHDFNDVFHWCIMTPSRDISRLLEIMAAAANAGTGCPWDLEQNFATIAPYTIEEAYEVADAISRGDLEDLRDELGDLLLQVVFHARMAEEQKAFAFRRRGRGDLPQDDPKTSACLRRQGRTIDAVGRQGRRGSGSRPRRRRSARRGGPARPPRTDRCCRA